MKKRFSEGQIIGILKEQEGSRLGLEIVVVGGEGFRIVGKL